MSRIVSKTKTLTKLSYKFSKNLFTKGPIESLRITKKFLSERKNPQVSTEQQNAELMKVQDILKETFGGLKPIQTLFVENNKLRINFLTPALNESSLFGGTTTGLIFATLLANSLNASLRIVSTDTSCDLSVYYKVISLYNLKAPEDVTAFDASWKLGRSNGLKLEVSKNDLFISTIWWTSYLARNASVRKKFIYLIQEFEPVFYPNGIDRLLTLESYGYHDFLPVINTSNLYEFYKKNNFKFIEKEGVCFEPAFPINLFSPSNNSFKPKDKYNFFFYSRPGTPRNLYLRGLDIIDKAISQGIIDTNKWNIYFAGESIGDFKFCNDSQPIILGKLSYAEYSKLISDIDLGISLMEAPHPSYPPLDLVSSGAVILTNNSEGKKDLDYSKNLIFSDIKVEEMLLNLRKAVDLALDFKTRQKNFNENKLKRDWNESFKEVIDKIKKDLEEGKI